MKMYLLQCLLCLFPLLIFGQSGNPLVRESNLELAAEQIALSGAEEEIELLHENRTGRLINLNGEDFEELITLGLLTDWQVAQLIFHKKMFGPFIHVNELQTIPGWTPETIRSLLPFVSLQGKGNIGFLSNKMNRGTSQIITRTNGWRFGKGASASKDSSWLGDERRLLLQVRWEKNQWKAGFAAEKDPGEPLWKKGIQRGFDFYSAHLFCKLNGLIQTLALGDFTVNMGQGLIQWQSLAFRKSSDISWAKRQGPVFRPHRSAGEFNFHRGLAIQLKKGKWGVWVFASKRMLTANLVSDSLGIPWGVSAVKSGGYHRTASERLDKNKLSQFSSGFRIASEWQGLKIGINAVGYLFSHPFLPGNHPYQLYKLTGSRWCNLSTDFSFTRKNCHGFGEFALDKNGSIALVTGLLVSVDPKLDFSLVTRAMSPCYQSLYSNAFTEGTTPSNENGFLGSISLRPDHRFRMDAYIDFYRFPWLRYQIGVPHASGIDRMLQLSFRPDKATEILVRLRHEIKANDPPNDLANDLGQLPLAPSGKVLHQGLRIHVSRRLSTALTMRLRLETAEIRQLVGCDAKFSNLKEETGFLCFAELRWKPDRGGPPITFRAQYFDTDGYNSRIYAYEPDPGFGISIPASYGRGASLLLVSAGNLTSFLSLGARASLSLKADAGAWLSEFRAFFVLKLQGLGGAKKNTSI